MKPYNPLEKENLGKSVAKALLESVAHPLGSIEPFKGAGIYAIYYSGNFDAYARLKAWNHDMANPVAPIYIGKAVPSGGRKGKVDANIAAKGSNLFRRIDEHRKSVEIVNNLDVEDFSCRFLIVDDIWIPLGETLLVQHFQPVWNAVIDGFGNHDPGKGRYKGARPSWDVMHPGRQWAEKCAPAKLSPDDLAALLEKFWDNFVLEDSSDDGMKSI